MKSKEKTKKHIRITLKNVIYFVAFIVAFSYLIMFFQMYFQKEVYAKETDVEPNSEIKISNAEKINNIDSVIEQNVNADTREEYVVQEVELEYLTKYEQNKDLPKGMMQVIQEGRNGTQEITLKRVYEQGEIISEEQISTKITKASINKIVEIGEGKYKSTYRAKVGDTVYSTSDRLSVMVEPTEQAQKIATLPRNSELKITEVQNDWYKIQSDSTRGYVKAEATTYINPIEENEEETNISTPNTTQITKLSFDMPLNKPSGFSLEQFKKVLSDEKDVNKVFESNAEYFYYIEKQYNINGLFVASIGIHESAWGTSKISKDKNNLFGYGAYDSNPYNGAYNFSEYSESIDLIARVLVKYYLNPKGTSIYDGQKAAGTYYNGATLSGVNTKYATDKNWANSVYSYMKYLYNKISYE